MYICQHCESIIPDYYTNCPICNNTLTKKLKRKVQVKEQEQEQEEKMTTMVIEEHLTTYDLE